MQNMEWTGQDTTAEPIDDEEFASTAQQPLAIAPDLAARYVETARLVASLPEDEAIARFTPASDDPRLVELRQFLAFISIGWRTKSKSPFYFFPQMREEIRVLHRHRHRDGRFPEFLFGRATSNTEEGGKPGDLIPIRFLADYTSCGPGKSGDFPSLRRQMGKLLLLNALGWDVYGCPNPILYACRIQRAIPWILNLVAESDDATLDEQMEACRRMKGMVGAVVFSGRRSLHQYYRLASPVRNPHAITPSQLDAYAMTANPAWKRTRWHQVRALKRAKRLRPITVEAFRYCADLLRGHILERARIQLCPGTLFNFACLARVPGFAHAGSGGLSRLVSVDCTAARHDNALGEPNGVRYSPYWRKLLGIADDSVFPARRRQGHQTGRYSCSCGALDAEDSVSSERPGISEQEASQNTEQNDPAESEAAERAAFLPRTNEELLPTDTKGVTPRGARGHTFLDDLDDFDRLRAHGIPGRRIRRSLHRLMVNVALLRGWTRHDQTNETIMLDQDRIGREWRMILEQSHGSVGCTVEQGVAEMLGFVDTKNRQRSDGHYRFDLPDCTRLPDIDGRRRLCLAERIRRLAAEEADCGAAPTASTVTGLVNIIIDILYPMMRTHPAQCLRGGLAVQAKAMQAKCPRARFAPVRPWLYRLNVIRPTRKACHAAGLTRIYFVNIPLVIWLMGFSREDLAWDRHDAQCGGREPEENE